jgi:hypothetical protein
VSFDGAGCNALSAPTRLAGGIALAVLLLALGCGARALQLATQEPRLWGEHGLFVTWAADTLRVSWITRENGPGWAQLVPADGTAPAPVTTPAGSAHTVRFAQPARGEVALRYGSRDDLADRHETRVRFPLERPRPPVTFDGVDSIYVMGDVHGELDTLRAVLANAGLIDRSGRWTGSRSHLVIAGDMMDRGADVNGVLWFLYGLEPQIERAGGSLDVVLGNHEVMVMLNDLRYVHPKEAAVANAHGVTYDRMFDPRSSVLGTWLLSKPAAVRIDDVLIAHGGVSTDYLPYTLRSLDDSLAAYTREELFYRWADTTYPAPLDSAGLARRNELFWGERGLLWYRGFADSDSLGAQIDSVLRRFDARVHVIGHTPGPTIRVGYAGKVLMVNTSPFAAEMLLLVRRGDGYQQVRIRSTGTQEPLVEP